jgi:hypothetical protein
MEFSLVFFISLYIIHFIPRDRYIEERLGVLRYFVSDLMMSYLRLVKLTYESVAVKCGFSATQ